MRTARKVTIRILFPATVAVLSITVTSAQELEPRLWANVPIDLNFIGAGYAYSKGNIFFDPSLPIEDAQGAIDILGFRYVRSFSFFGKLAKAEALLPHAAGDWSGFLDGEFRTRSEVGLADPRIRFAVNFVGSPALDGKTFRSYRQRTIVGASLQVIVPLGDYDPSKLINLGSNRWTFRPQIGVSRAIKNWTLELTGSAWFFTNNDDFFGGSLLKQDPVYALQVHGLYFFKPGLWVSANFGLADGGDARVDGALRSTLQTNSRWGLAVAIPVNRRQGLKFGFTRGLATRIGADYKTYSVGYLFLWGGKKSAAGPAGPGSGETPDPAETGLRGSRG
jgi:hypothetical protein